MTFTPPRLTPLSSDRLVLEPLRPTQADALYRYRSNPRIAEFQSWWPQSVDEVSAFIAALPPIGHESVDGWTQLGVVLRDTGELVGDVGVCGADRMSRQAQFGITIAPEFHRRGFAAEAVRTLFAFLLASQRKHRVSCSVDPRNTASMALMQSLGMRREAHHIESYLFRDEWVDDVVFALLRRESGLW